MPLLARDSTFEEKALELWKEYYVIDGAERQRKMGDDIVPKVKSKLEKLKGESQGEERFKRLGEKLVDITAGRFGLPKKVDKFLANMEESQEMTAHGIAAAIKAMSLYYRDKTV